MSSPEACDDVALMRRFVAGDEGAFERLAGRYEGPLLNFFFRLTGDRQAAEDLVQETFLRILRSRKTYEVRASFRTFLYRIARNLWIDRYRSMRSRPRLLSLDREDRKKKGGTIADHLAGPSIEPEARLVGEETRRVLEEAIAGLPAVQREVFVFWLETKMKYAEISKILDVPVGTIKSRMHGAVHALKKALEKEGRKR